jgi:hypothetical protein
LKRQELQAWASNHVRIYLTAMSLHLPHGYSAYTGG